jgi:putative PIN family toxin of toxin-antitoxin system
VIGEHELFFSKAILDELLGVLARKFAMDREELARVALFLSELAMILRPRRRLSVLDDETDNRILECGLAGRVDAIVTGNKKMLKLASHAGIRIITIREFLDS